MKRLVSIGECMIELAPAGNGTFGMGFAGDTFNTAWYAKRLGGSDLDVQYLTAVGDDEPSKRMIEVMDEAGIVPRAAVRANMSVGLYMISLKDGERSFSYWRDASAAKTLADDLHEISGVTAGDIVYFSGITLAILPEAGRKNLLSSLARVKEFGVQIVFDPNLRPRLWPNETEMRHSVMQAAALSDIVLPSFEDEASFFDDANTIVTAERYSDAGAKTIVVKNGAEPVLLSSQGTLEIISTRPAQVVVDTTAAGDSFNAAFIVACLAGMPLSEAVEHGCALARQVIGARGALVDI